MGLVEIELETYNYITLLEYDAMHDRKLGHFAWRKIRRGILAWYAHPRSETDINRFVFMIGYPAIYDSDGNIHNKRSSRKAAEWLNEWKKNFSPL